MESSVFRKKLRAYRRFPATGQPARLRQIKAARPVAAMMRAMADPIDLDRHARRRRGLFRLWLVLSAIFVLGVAAVSFDSLRREVDRAELMRFMAKQADPPLPMECAQARGVEGRDYDRAPPSPGERYRLVAPPATCWYQRDRLRALYPDYAGLSDAALAEKLYGAIGLPLRSPPAPFALGLRVALLAIGAPLLALAIGTALLWAAAGFQRQRA
jgi:hypothetical protein